MRTFATYYFDEAIRDLPGVIETAKERLDGVDFDTMVGTGFSGGIVIPALALSMGKKFVLIRKEGDDSHHGGGKLVGQLGGRWIFVDDFISTGRTRERVIRKIASAVYDTRVTTTMVGQYMYQRYWGEEEKPGKFEPFSEDWAPKELKAQKKTSACPCSLCTQAREGR